MSQNTISTLKNYTDRGYTDQEELDNLSLVDMNGRVYDPTVGRMISADPTVPDLLYSQAFNRYSYVYNSPLEYTDPSGFTSCPPTQRHCPTSSDGSGDSSTNTETGSHIPGVDTGATCAGDCGAGNWGPMGPGTGGAGNGNEGSGPNESNSSSSNTQAGMDCMDGQCSELLADNDVGQLGGIQVIGVRLTSPPHQPYFENNWQYDQSMLQMSLSQGLTPMYGQSNGDPKAVLNFLKKRGSLDISIHLAYGAGVILSLNFSQYGIAWSAAFAPGIALDFSGGYSVNIFGTEGLYGGVDIAGGVYGVGGNLLLGAGQNGLVVEPSAGFNLGLGIQGVFGYTSGYISFQDLINAGNQSNPTLPENIHP